MITIMNGKTDEPMTLQQIYLNNIRNGWPDKGTVHSYIEVYAEILEPYRTTAKNILEIGILNGSSLRMWEQYFTGTVYGVDCTDQPVGGQYDLRTMIAELTHNIIIMDGTSEADIAKHFSGMKFDVIIDDGSHQIEHQVKSYFALKDYLSEGGIYIIEDIQDIDTSKIIFENIDSEKTVLILDRRKIKGRYDDVLIVIQ